MSVEELITEVLSHEIHDAVEREGIFFDHIGIGMVIVDALDDAFKTALDDAFNAALDEAINKVINNIDIEDIISTYKFGLLSDAVHAGLDWHDVANELDFLLETSILGEDLRKAVKDALIGFFQDLIYPY